MENSPIVKAVKRVLPAVVSINVSKKVLTIEGAPLENAFPSFEPSSYDPPIFNKKSIKVGGGSGFIVDSEGIVLTNRHVVSESAASYAVTLNDERKFSATVLAKDPINDIAVLKINGHNLPIAEMGDSSSLDLAQTVIAIGNVLGIFKNTVSVGVVSGLSRKISTESNPDNPEQIRLSGLIQTDAAVNPGSSGGPLIDIEGKAIGINSAMVFMAENIGFALPINTAKKALEEIKTHGRIRKPYLGIRYILLSPELQKAYNLPSAKGALVISDMPDQRMAVLPESPAQKAGVQEFDIIIEANGEKITQDNTLEDALQRLKVGDSFTLKILRNGKIKKAALTLEEAA